MTRDELIEKEAEEIYQSRIDLFPQKIHYSIIEVALYEKHLFKAGINSQLAKDLQELAVIEGKIEVLIEVDNKYGHLVMGMQVKLIELETQRTQLLTKLNLEL